MGVAKASSLRVLDELCTNTIRFYFYVYLRGYGSRGGRIVPAGVDDTIVFLEIFFLKLSFLFR